MPPAATGLQRDIRLIRRRAWLFIPFLLVGILAALFIGRVAGDANAVASMQLETVFNASTLGGDRGLRIFEAQSMTSTEEFHELVRAQAGDPDLDMARFSVSLNPISIADGVARGILTVSIQDSDKATAEELRAAWLSVFIEAFTSPEGLFRTRYLESKTNVAEIAEQQYAEVVAQLQQIPELASLPIDELVRPIGLTDSLIGQLNIEDANLRSDLALVEAAIAAGGSDIQAASILQTEIPPGAGLAALEDRANILRAAINEVESRRVAVSDTSFTPEVLALIDGGRAAWQNRNDAQIALNNARAAVVASQSTAEVTLTSSGGIAGTLIGRVAVAIAVTLVFGLIAIYLLEWLSQVRRGTAATAD
jgi:hypothetical protein